MQEKPSRAERKPVAAFILSLLAGLWMLVPGVLGYAWWFPITGGWMHGEHMRGGWMWRHGVMRDIAPMFWWPWFGLVAGLIVLVGAVMLYSKPSQSQGWGIVILVLSAFNVFLGLGGFLASMLGIIGGALAIVWRPEP